MKKFICVLMALALTLSLGVTVFAAKEGCPETGCTGELVEWTEEKVVGTVTCEQTGDSSMRDELVRVYYYCECNKCSYNENDDWTEVRCSH